MEELKEYIYSKCCEEKINAEIMLQVTRVIEVEDKFLKDFIKEKWQERFELCLAIFA